MATEGDGSDESGQKANSHLFWHALAGDNEGAGMGGCHDAARHNLIEGWLSSCVL